jgi:DNA-binding GntR family transcriptional regulator
MNDLKKTPVSSDEIYSKIKFMVLKGEYCPGSRIDIKKLCDQFGVSRIPIRDVMNRLSGERLVEKGGNGGFIVTRITETDVRETYELRAILEGYLVKQAAMNFGEEEVSSLEENLKHQEKEKNDLETYIQLNRKFHEHFIKATQNGKFVEILRSLMDYQFRFDRINWMTHGSFFVNLTYEQHQEIFDAIKKRNGELAEKIVKLHMATGVEFLVKALKDKKILS